MSEKHFTQQDEIWRENLMNLISLMKGNPVPTNVLDLNQLVYYLYIGYELYVGSQCFLRHRYYPKARPLIQVDCALAATTIEKSANDVTMRTTRYPHIVFKLEKSSSVDGWDAYQLVVIERMKKYE